MKMVDLPPVSASPADAAKFLAIGLWVFRPDEWSKVDGVSVEEWRDGVAAVCENFGIPCEFQRYEEDGITVAVNPSRPPTDAQLEYGIKHMVNLRPTKEF